ncbi:MAG: hypothetical protein RLZ98_1944 [Pseudomonadota bacterium]|jgi:Flp pilus assembly protein TadG
MSISGTCFSRFRKDEGGAIAVIFALSLIVVVLITGLAIDTGRAVHANRKIGAALDAAALAAAKGLRVENMNDAEVTALAEKYFDTNLRLSGGNFAVVNGITVVIDRAKGAVEINVDAYVPTYFGALAGVDRFPLPRAAAAIFDAKDIEVAVQLDVTGSMGGRKIGDLTVATKDLVDILIPDEPTGQKVRIAYAPYSAGVNVGSYLRSVNGDRPSARNCVYERQSDANEFTDMLPIGLDAMKVKEDLTAPPGRSVQNCPDAEIVPMTDDKSALKSTIDGYRANGTTAGQLGTAWAWYLLSPRWGGIWPSDSRPAEYRDGKTIKVAVVMTDGIYNTIGGVNWGDGSPQSIQAGDKAIRLCEGMRNEGIVVYTVGFELRGASEPIRVLERCASNPGNFFNASNGEELRSAFRAIAEQIVTLRLSK